MGTPALRYPSIACSLRLISTYYLSGEKKKSDTKKDGLRRLTVGANLFPGKNGPAPTLNSSLLVGPRIGAPISEKGMRSSWGGSMLGTARALCCRRRCLRSLCSSLPDGCVRFATLSYRLVCRTIAGTSGLRTRRAGTVVSIIAAAVPCTIMLLHLP